MKIGLLCDVNSDVSKQPPYYAVDLNEQYYLIDRSIFYFLNKKYHLAPENKFTISRSDELLNMF